jgi:hypothetical protein
LSSNAESVIELTPQNWLCCVLGAAEAFILMSKLTRKRKPQAAPSSIDERLARLESKKQKLLISKQIQDLRQKQKDLK